jgi:hypothetical protein
LGGCQAGGTYYFSPLNSNVFGIVHCGVQGGTLHAYPYHEGMGRKGGDNVASLFMLYLEQKGWLQERVTGKELLTIIMDNCPGQNKNNHVIRLALYLVEAKYFKKVTCLFYIAGHTKNCADRWFNTLKKKYRKMNIYTYDQLCHNFRTNTRIKVTNYKDGTFKYWKNFCDQFYTLIPTNNQPGGNILPNHLFVVEEKNPTTMVVKRNNLVDSDKSKSFDVKKNDSKFPDRVFALRNRINLETIIEKGIPDIKRKELFCNWRRFVPEDYADKLCPYLGPVVLARLRKATNEKTSAKKKALALASSPTPTTTTTTTTPTPKRKRKPRQQQSATPVQPSSPTTTPVRKKKSPPPVQPATTVEQQVMAPPTLPPSTTPQQQVELAVLHQHQQQYLQQQVQQQQQMLLFQQQLQNPSSLTPEQLFQQQNILSLTAEQLYQLHIQLHQQQLELQQQQNLYFDSNTRDT